MEMVLGGQLELHLLQGCCLEAERADRVAVQLLGLRNALGEGTHTHLLMTMEEVSISGQLLRELAEYSKVHFSRVPVVLDYLEILLPCLSRSLRDITTYYEDRTLTKENRWRKMYHSMTQEAGGLSLPQRFILYNRFLSLLRELLLRSPNFDFNTMECTRLQLMQLREARGIPPPPIRLNSTIRPDSVLDDDSGIATNIHWAEKIFSLPLPSRTPLKHQQSSKAYGPHAPWSQVRMPSDARILFIRSFNERQITLIVYQSGRDRCPYLLLRTFHMGTPWFSLRGAHELCVERNGSSLQFWRWSSSEHCPKMWANLCFMTWEELVLLYCCFLSFKTRNSLTVQVANEDLALWGERKLFQARIVDDGFMHSLIVYEDYVTKGIRLHAAVWDGDLRQCPVWTAFITHQSASPKWMRRVSKTRVRLADIQLYVFCQEYRQQNQRVNRAGAFEIRFVSEEAAKRFKELFSPALIDESTATESTQT
ncbi:uncharacterized protein FFB20_09837 [Fusarium fujikuroi]|uniref:Uncharacterized protein n=1 Tax=Gibberella fujikuroi (strain CBS 195.34 / IMI 58289 / NRRL A-6831) TaxID=1279085 RepID=S0DPR0_GIBF5|nr:uncharacterized protein FFUJ_00898 [Fusarium fujikuroi IMI 58289]KLP10206.1 uncharacterized protein Y057_13414 [Fusarium fujikuroi]KLP22775.1 uncharacterized protein LW94_6675 [Fusarium fujikuroi]CCT62543.1 uncharacterized protein FFUJ_00898 [Fusarium fujikuroi IMI 58289]SCN67318.1 uncharacterized protein FFE2_00972 [Fusarium fujikuroi]SCN70605.1 uncharacterized protein FFC1_00967 [Fusarium fujikuroi]